MTISFRCVSCQHPYEVRAELAGKRGRCKRCGEVFTIPEGDADTFADRYALDDAPTAPASKSLEEATTVPATKRKKARPVSGIVGLERLPLWGYAIYQALILAVGAASMIATGEKQQILAIAAMLLGLGPIFAWALLNSNQAVAFRDGLLPGLAYMFFQGLRTTKC